MFRKVRLSLVLALVLALATVGVAFASHISVTGISIPQVDENAAASHPPGFTTGPGPYFQDLFPAAPIGALGTLLAPGFDVTNPDDTLYSDGDTVSRIQSAVYEGVGAADGLYAYLYQVDCTGGNVAPLEVSIPLSGATLHATAGGLSTTPFGYIATQFNFPTPFEPLPFDLYTANLEPFNLSEFGGTFGIGGNTAAGWTHASLGVDEVLAGSTTDNFWSGSILLFVTDRAPVISHITVTAGIASFGGTQPNTVAALIPGPGVGEAPGLPPEEIIVDPPEFQPLIEVELDVKPGSDPNAVNTKSNGQLPIGIYGSETFDVRDIDPATITIECMGFSSGDIRVAYEDLVVEDGIEDMIIHVPMQSFPWGAPKGTLVTVTVTGELFDGTPFAGEDVVLIVK